jgi:hypothetical protein
METYKYAPKKKTQIALQAGHGGSHQQSQVLRK